MRNHLQWQHRHYYWQLMRADRPIGSLLLLWPTYWALWLASEGMPSQLSLLVFSAGVWVMRSAGCVINDYADRKVDGHVERTAQRPLAAGLVSSAEALQLFASLIGIAVLLVLLLSWQTILLSVVALLLASIYPFMKRYTHLPQVVLGAAFSWSIPMAFMATQGQLPLLCWLLYLANLLWTVGYDTYYAMVDRNDDVKIGVKSTAILFGRFDLIAIALLMSSFMLIMAYLVIELSLRWPFWAGWMVAAALLIRQLWLCRMRDRTACFRGFLNNNYVGLMLFIGIAGHYLIGG